MLGHVRQFVSEQSAAFGRARRVSTLAEHDMISDGVSECIDGARRFGGEGIGVKAHPAEIVAEALLHVLPQRRLQGPTGAGKSLVHAVGRHVCLPNRLSRKAPDMW